MFKILTKLLTRGTKIVSKVATKSVKQSSSIFSKQQAQGRDVLSQFIEEMGAQGRVTTRTLSDLKKEFNVRL